MVKLPPNWENFSLGKEKKTLQEVTLPGETKDAEEVALPRETVKFSIQKTVLILFGVMFLVLVGSGLAILDSLNSASEDAEIINALGRQRMLS